LFWGIWLAIISIIGSGLSKLYKAKKYSWLMLKNFTPRLYQETILNTCANKNTLVVLPTGMGKTAIALLLASQRISNFPESRILFLAPTKPLAEQHMTYFKKYIEDNEESFALFTGLVRPEIREELWKKSKYIFSTPQGLENDIISRKINLEEVSLLIFDEAHRAVGDYSYNFVAKQYEKLAKFPRILALTASPGSELDKIEEVCRNLFIEDIEIRTDRDPDVKPYIQEVNIEWIKVELPEKFLEIKKFLEAALRERLQKLKKYGILKRAEVKYVSKKDLLSLQGQIQGRLAKGERDFLLYQGISLLAEIMKLEHALELLETQDLSSLFNYLDKLQKESSITKTKAIKNIVKDLNFRSAYFTTMNSLMIEHPKLTQLRYIVEQEVKKNKGVKVIVFNQYRDSALKIQEELVKSGVNAKIFVGQVKKGETGLTQKKQLERLQEFREGKFNVLIATAVGEEGLDIPQVDLVIFYEPIPSAIRSIQRRGRTGRLEKGKVIILSTDKTRDEAYKWVAFHKEKKMYRHLEKLRNSVDSILKKKTERTLTEYNIEEVKIFVDYREKASGVIKELIDFGVNIKLDKLENADYILSNRVAVEFKTKADFINSLCDGRLLQQIKNLKQNYDIPLIMVEGEEDIYSIRKVHPNAIRGLISSINIDFNVPIIYTRNTKESASFLNIIAKREQEEKGKDFSLHGERKPLTLKEQQEYIISALPGIGATLAKPLLKKFKTVKRIVNASEESLQKVELIGEKKAKAIKDVVEGEYKE